MLEIADIYEFVLLYKEELVTFQELVMILGEEKAQKIINFLQK